MTKDLKTGMAIGAAVTLGAEVIVGGIAAVVKVIRFKKLMSDLDKEFEDDNDDEELFEDTNK